jgi:hypothetical protein
MSVMGEPVSYWHQLHGYIAVVGFSHRIMFCVCVFAANYSVRRFSIWSSNATVHVIGFVQSVMRLEEQP